MLCEFQLPPETRLLCCFGDEAYLNPVCPASRRGVFRPILKKGNGGWPEYIRCQFPRHQALIYLPGPTCSAPDGVLFVMAFSHELRHFQQWTINGELLARCGALQNKFDIEARKWTLPHERDAIRESKRIAERLLGKDHVDEFAREHVQESSDIHYWEFFDQMDPQDKDDWQESASRYLSNLDQTTSP